MKLHFTDQTFSFELLRAASYGLYGGSEIGEVLATAKQIREGDFESWHIAWQYTAARIEALAAHALHEGHRVSAGQAFCARAITIAPPNFSLHPVIRAAWKPTRRAAKPSGNFLICLGCVLRRFVFHTKG